MQQDKPRPKLTDPEELAIIRSIYFEDHRPKGDDIDPLERLDRMERKQKQINHAK